MTRFRPLLRLLPLLALAGCAGIEITREPFVVPAPDTTRFQVNAKVLNYGLTDSPSTLWLKLHAEYWPVPKPPSFQPPCVLDDFLTVGPLGARSDWRVDKYELTGHQPDSLAPCLCLQDQCTGNIDLTLFVGSTPQTRVPLQGLHTSFNFTWIPSGDPEDKRALIRENSMAPGR